MLKEKIEARVPWKIGKRIRREAAVRHLYPADIIREILIAHYARVDAALAPAPQPTQASSTLPTA